MEDYFEGEGYYKYEASEMAVEALEGMGYDGITHIGGGRRNGTNSTSHQVYIAFHPEQIKNIDNAKPTSNPDIQYSLTKDIENFDNSWYNEIKLPAAEQKRVQSEALTWHASKRNQLITQTLSNGITYRYTIDDDGIVHIYGKEQSASIHDLGENYGNADTTQLDSITEELWTGQRDNSSDSSFSQDGRESRKDDTNDNYIVSREGRSNRTGYSEDRTNAYRKPKKRHWHFNEDGSTEVTYSDGSKEILDIAPTKEASSTDGVFFDGDHEIQHSLTEYTEAEKKEHNKIVLNHFGKTYKWAETGYLLLDGTKLDLSGKHEGAPGGYRTVDHRDITEALGYDYGGEDYSGSLVQFMSEGNIRIIPEMNGINLSVQPTQAQEQALADYISRFRGEVVLDIDDNNGRTVVSVEYLPKHLNFNTGKKRCIFK